MHKIYLIKGQHMEIPPEESTDLEELEQFAKMFKQKRIKLGKLITIISYVFILFISSSLLDNSLIMSSSEKSPEFLTSVKSW